MTPRSKINRRGLLALTMLPLVRAASAQAAWPTRPVKLIVNFPPGSLIDNLARAFARLLEKELGQPLVVENRTGAAGNIGAEAVARAPADGYTLLFTPGSVIVTNPVLYKTEVHRQLTPVAAPMTTPLTMVTRADAPWRSVAELAQYGRSHPGRLKFGSAGAGSPLHIIAAAFLHGANLQAEHIPYKASSDALIGLINGDIDFYLDGGAATPFVAQGKLRILAITAQRRMAAYPGVPTLSEAAGFPIDFHFPSGLFAPRKTPPEIINSLHAASEKVWRSSAWKAALATMSGEPSQVFVTPAEFEARLDIDRARVERLIQVSGIRVE